MNLNTFFPTTMITLSVMAALPYLATGDWRRGIYWIAAAVITATVTF
jgi:hypothetical protein